MRGTCGIEVHPSSQLKEVEGTTLKLVLGTYENIFLKNVGGENDSCE